MFRVTRIVRPQRKHDIKLLMAAVVLFVVPNLASPQSNDSWVSDQFEVMLRSGKSTQQRIIKLLPSGTKVTVLEQDDESGYTRVRTSNGTEGWMLTRYLVSSPTARLQLSELQTRLFSGDEMRRQLQARVLELEQEREALQTQLGRTETSSLGLQQQLDEIRELSSNAIRLDGQNKRLKQQLIDNERQIDDLESENLEISTRSDREWFIVGAAAVTVGLLLGLIIPRMRWRKKSNWSEF